ncbi:MAG: hypothetical protein ACO2O6_03325 [Candidatus Hydrothermia bacterium]|jgi:membrane-associated HD superfamily phosphohydrolase
MIALVIIIGLGVIMLSLASFLLSNGFLLLKPDIVQSDWLPYSNWIPWINFGIIFISIIIVFWILRYQVYWSYGKSFFISFIILLILLILENFVFKLKYKSDYIESGEFWLSISFTILSVFVYFLGILLFSAIFRDIRRPMKLDFLTWPFPFKRS